MHYKDQDKINHGGISQKHKNIKKIFETRNSELKKK